MKEKEFKISDATILSAHDVDSKLLVDFYNIMFPDRKDYLPKIWKWLNRSEFYKNKIPLVILYNNRVIAHAGMIPFNILLNKRQYTVAWFIDFAVLPEFQRRGLGIKLSRKWMEFSDIHLALTCNKMSMGVLKKCEWTQNFDTYFHIFPILPFNHPRLIRNLPLFLCNILNKISSPFYKYIYSKYSVSIGENKFYDLNPDILEKFTSSSKIQSSTNVVHAVRDSDYFSWRLLNSPDISKYSIIIIDDVSLLIKLCDNNYSKYIDILLVSDLSKYTTIRKIIASIAIWARKKGYYFIRFYTSRKELSGYLRKSLKSFVRNPVYMYCSKGKELLGKLKKSNWNWGLIDNDFEKFQ